MKNACSRNSCQDRTRFPEQACSSSQRGIAAHDGYYAGNSTFSRRTIQFEGAPAAGPGRTSGAQFDWGMTVIPSVINGVLSYVG